MDYGGMLIMISWKYYPLNKKLDETSGKIVETFINVESVIDSESHNCKDCSLKSNEVLTILRPGLESLSFDVEISEGKNKTHTIPVPVLFGLNGYPEKSFYADAYSSEKRYVIEVESGQGYTNYKFLKDFFESCMMLDVDYACIANSEKTERLFRTSGALSTFETVQA